MEGGSFLSERIVYISGGRDPRPHYRGKVVHILLQEKALKVVTVEIFQDHGGSFTRLHGRSDGP
jgi:hypothetical protein